MNIASVYFCKEAVNCGDQVASPFDYVPAFGDTIRRIDLRAQIEDMMGFHLVFGGGGIMHSGSQVKMDWLTRVSRLCNPNSKLIAWGCGLNHHDTTAFVYPEFLTRFDLVGLREWNNPYSYVPCPSCLHPAFESATRVPISSEHVVFSHHGGNAFSIDGVPRLTNAKSKDEMRGVMHFLASGETIITNSFHGAYWGLLLGRKVVIWKPFSNRFYGFKPVVVFCDENNWRQRASEAVVAPDYLTECRDINLQFSEKVMECIKGDAYRYEAGS